MSRPEGAGAPVSRLSGELSRALRPLAQFFERSAATRLAGGPRICDFLAGDPHEPVIAGFTDALVKAATPQRDSWFAYSMNEREPCGVVAEALRARHGMPFEREDVFLVPGTFGGLSVTLRALVDQGDEVIFVIPPWFFYEAMILDVGAVPVRVEAQRDTWDLDLAGIEAAITARTRAVIVNTPHNPTGRIYPPETLEHLGRILAAGSERNGRTIYLISDESYNRILFDGRTFPTPTRWYESSILLSTYTKVLLTPGERIGYGALAPSMADRQAVREAILLTQMVSGWTFPSALLQHALADLERLSIDLGALERKRDRMAGALQAMGYNLHVPEATFYLFPRSPVPDDMAFTRHLAERNVFVLPGTLVETPGYFRISLTATEEMIDRSLPVFEQALTAVP
jgi:aspartate aminotransferase